MDDSADDPRLRELFRHQEWVHGLALRLSSDAAAADDLAQETWLAAWRAHPVGEVSRAWLGGVVRNLSKRALRRRAAREAREARIAASDRVPSSDELLARAELQRRILGAVAELPERQRAVILQRYYEGLRLEEIARRAGVPGSTARSWLLRAHESLRARLDREYGGDRGAWSVLFLPALPIHATTPILAGAALTMKTKLAVGAALALAAAFAWWELAPHRSPTAGNAAPGATRTALSAEDAARPPAAVAASPRAPDRASAAPAAVDRVLLSGTFLGAEGADLGDASITLVDAQRRRHSVSVGARATYSLFGPPPGSVRMQGAIDGFRPIDETFELPAGQERARHDVKLVPSLVLPVKILDAATGAPLFPATSTLPPATVVVSRGPLPRGPHTGARMTTRGPLSRYSAREHGLERPPIPAGYDGRLQVDADPPLAATCVLREAVLATLPILGNETELVFRIPAETFDRSLAGVDLRVVDAATRQPVENARVQLGYQDSTGQSAASDKDGRAAFQKTLPGRREVQVSGAGYAVRSMTVFLPPGEVLELGDVELRPPSTLTGRVIGPDGEPVSARLAVMPVRSPPEVHGIRWNRQFDSATDGTFQATWAESGPLRIHAQAKGYAVGTLDADASSGRADGLELKLDRGTQLVLHTAPGARCSTEVLIVDAHERAIDFVTAYPAYDAELTLAPGKYGLFSISDGAIAHREWIEIGTEPMAREVPGP